MFAPTGCHIMRTVVGMDVQSINEVRASLAQFGRRYTCRLFTDHEIEDCGEGSPIAALRYAERFAAKEAVLKVLNVREVVPSWKDIEVRRRKSEGFEVFLYGVAAELAHERGIRSISLSISHARGVATAAAVAS
jgi:holo-[acyl-carrier protein] synthase